MHLGIVVSNIVYFQTYFGKWSNLTNMFQKGWNHQWGIICSMYLFFPATISHNRSTFHEPFWFRGEASLIYNIALEDPGCVFTGSWVTSHVEGMIVPHPRDFLIEASFSFRLVVFVDGYSCMVLIVFRTWFVGLGNWFRCWVTFFSNCDEHSYMESGAKTNASVIGMDRCSMVGKQRELVDEVPEIHHITDHRNIFLYVYMAFLSFSLCH